MKKFGAFMLVAVMSMALTGCGGAPAPEPKKDEPKKDAPATEAPKADAPKTEEKK